MGSGLCRRPNSNPNRPQTPPIGDTTFRPLRNNEDDVRSKTILVAGHEEGHRKKVQDCTACLASGKNLKYQLPKKHYRKLEKLSKPGQEIQIDFTGKLHNKHLHGETQILIAVDRFSKWPTVKICKSAETKEVINFLTSNFNLYGIPEKIKSDKGGAFISKEYRELCKNRNIEIEYCTPRMHTGNGAVERAIQTLKNRIIANLEDGIGITESVNRELRVMRFTIHTGLKITPFELHHGRKPRTELTNIVKDGKTYLSNWSEMPISAPTRPKIPIYVGRDADGENTNHMVMAKTKAEKKQFTENQKSPKKKSSVRYPFNFVEKNYNKKSLEGRFQNKIQTAVSGTESTIKTDTGKNNKPEIYFGTIVSDRKKGQKRTGNQHKRRDKPQKQTLLEVFEREVWPMGRDPTGHPERQIKNRTKSETTGK